MNDIRPLIHDDGQVLAALDPSVYADSVADHAGWAAVYHSARRLPLRSLRQAAAALLALATLATACAESTAPAPSPLAPRSTSPSASVDGARGRLARSNTTSRKQSLAPW